MHGYIGIAVVELGVETPSDHFLRNSFMTPKDVSILYTVPIESSDEMQLYYENMF